MKIEDELRDNLDQIERDLSNGDGVSRSEMRNIGMLINEIHDHNRKIADDIVDRLHSLIDDMEDFYGSGIRSEVTEDIEKGFGQRLNIDNLTPRASGIIGNIEPQSNVVFLFGAGASRASGIPLVNELLTELVEQAKRTQNEELNDFMLECEQNEEIGIEDLLTAVYLAEFAVSESSTLRLLKTLLFNHQPEKTEPTSGLFAGYQAASEEDSTLDDQVETDPTSVNFIQDAIQTLFASIASEMIPDSENQTHSELQRFIEKHEKTSIITTNYDYCIEKELFGDVSVNTVLNSTKADSEYEVDLYKMHGSITWTYCDTCQSIDCVDPERVQDKFYPEEDTLGFPVKGICHVCSGERRPLLVPPTSFKFVQFPPLIDIRAKAKKELQEADYIIPVGYSFSDEDAYIYKLVWGAMRSNKDAQMIIVDPEARDLADKLKNRFKVQASDFDSERVVAYSGRSENVMAELVNQLLPSESTAGDAETNRSAVEESAQ